jgi:hypothetical protein
MTFAQRMKHDADQCVPKFSFDELSDSKIGRASNLKLKFQIGKEGRGTRFYCLQQWNRKLELQVAELYTLEHVTSDTTNTTRGTTNTITDHDRLM